MGEKERTVLIKAGDQEEKRFSLSSERTNLPQHTDTGACLSESGTSQELQKRGKSFVQTRE